MTELRLDDDLELPRPVCRLRPGGSTVITVGSASKAFWAGLRIGWVRAAPDVIRSLVAARAYADLGSPVVEQLAVAWLLRDRRLGGRRVAHPPRAGAGEPRRPRRRAARHLPDWEFTVPHGGLTLWARTGGLSGSRHRRGGGAARRPGPVRPPLRRRRRLRGLRAAAVHGRRRASPTTAVARLAGGGAEAGPARRAPIAEARAARAAFTWPERRRACPRPRQAPRRVRLRVASAPRSAACGCGTLLRAPAPVPADRAAGRSTACRCASGSPRRTGPGVAGTWSRSTGPAPSRA